MRMKPRRKYQKLVPEGTWLIEGAVSAIDSKERTEYVGMVGLFDVSCINNGVSEMGIRTSTSDIAAVGFERQ